MAIGIIALISNTILLIVFFEVYFKTRHKERMAMIERGINIYDKKSIDRRIGLKIGIFMFCIGLGILVGKIVGSIFGSISEFTFSFVLIFSGIGMVLEKFLSKDQDEN